MPIKLSLQDKIEIVLIVGNNYKTYREAAFIFNQHHPDKIVSHTTVGRIFSKFKNSGSVENNFKQKHRRWATNENAEVAVMQSVVEMPTTSISTLSRNLNISYTSIQRLLKKNKFKAYKPKFVHTLMERDYDQRMYFSFWLQGKIEEDRSFTKFILFSDECTFTSNGVVSSQNCRWWADRNPDFIIETNNQYYFKVNVWCGIFNNRIIGPFFFREALNAVRYLQFLQNEFFAVLENFTLEERLKMYFQQDGASIHSTLEVRNWLNTTFSGKWIGRFSEINWPPRSPDMTPCDFFLWGYLKNKVYAHRPFQNVVHLEETIHQCIAEIPPHFLAKIQHQMYQRTILCIERNGRHVEI